ncbi:hypothetical protein C1H46_024837 [Malus baccata]|uniref:ascorbate ferrireductase (transmembrane) n=1 Tax=Malus baccata TaxID=106549 RepID=A0A540LSV6_MALBA|nr:hypothetical protein C1H46_024837 [Malus baccata]
MAPKSRSYQISATPATLFGHLLAMAITTLVLVWTLKFRGGFALESGIEEKILNYLFGFVLYVFPGGDMSSRGNFMPWHTFFGMVIFLLAVCTAETGLMERYKRSASRLTVGAHLFGILAIILMLVWLLHYRGGIDYESDNSDRVFNVHPFLMFFGFIFFAGEAMMAYKTVMSEHQGKKYMHALLHLIALCTGIFGICAAFRYHDMRQIDDMYTLHSWIGLGTFILYGLQWLVGAAAFLIPGGTPESRLRLIPWHMSMGRTILYLSICAALTGLMQKFTFLGLSKALGDRESHLINFTALAILLFGIFVDLSVALARYV